VAFARFVRALGFDGIQLGPQGQTSRINASPYDGSLFSRSILSLDLAALVGQRPWSGLMAPEHWHALVASNPRSDGKRVPYQHVFSGYCEALAQIHGRYFEDVGRRRPEALQLADRLAGFREANAWLRHDALYEALCAEHRHTHWRLWPQTGEARLDRSLCCPVPGTERNAARRRAAIRARHRDIIEGFELGQFLLDQQHRAWRESLARLGLRAYGDVQIGMSPRDTWSRQRLLLRDYRLGAPPSRTNPAGQPWGLGVLDPAQYLQPSGAPGPVLELLSQRLGKMLAEFDGLRIDHPHGLVCPWVYRADDPSPSHAVRHGARLFASPNLADHPELARYAIPRSDQLNPDPAVARHADDWVRHLDPWQIDRYAILFDALIDQVRAHGRNVQDVLAEVLSTQPYPLACVLARYGLGRFRVTQKADLTNPADVYRSENACPQDWVMVGNHDTAPLWRLAREWQGTPAGERQAWYLAHRLRPEGGAEPLARALMADPCKLAHAKFADLFLGPARQVLVFFTDLLGMEEAYNSPGVVSEENWTLRVPPDYRQRYAADIARGAALNIPCVLALALRGRGAVFTCTHRALIERLEQRAGWSAGGDLLD
jgi:4-alpha-glucanotransferase